MEKVDVEERKKMFDLMKDRELGGNMDWMYRGDKQDTEDFLLGKSVDKMVSDATKPEEQEGKEGGGSIISERIKANVALDMQAKMREDPLFAIRKKEEDARRRLLENPVKMKQLEKLVDQQRQRASKVAKKSKKDKKHKKKKKKKTKDSDSDSSESDDDIVNKYLKILTQKKKSGEAAAADENGPNKHQGENQKEKNGDSDDNHRPQKDENRPRYKEHSDNRNDNRDRRREEMGPHHRQDRGSRHSGKRASPDGPPHRRRRKSSSSPEQESEPETRPARSLQRQDSSEGEVSKKVYGLIKSVRHSMSAQAQPQPDVKSKNIKKSRSSSSRSRSRSPKSSRRKDSQRQHSPHRKHKAHKRRSSSGSRSRSPVKKRASSPHRRRRSLSKSPQRKRKSRSPPKRKLTAEEKQRKVQEMMDNAKWRDDQRRDNVQRYKHEDEKEGGRLEAYQGKAEFLSSMLADHASSSTVEDRLKRNKHNIQRTRAALNKNFTEH